MEIKEKEVYTQNQTNYSSHVLENGKKSKKFWLVFSIVVVAAVLLWLSSRKTNQTTDTARLKEDNNEQLASRELAVQQTADLLISKSKLNMPLPTKNEPIPMNEGQSQLGFILPDGALNVHTNELSYSDGSVGLSLGYEVAQKPYEIYQQLNTFLAKDGWEIVYAARALNVILIEAEKNKIKLQIVGEPIRADSAKIYAKTYTVK